jgi:hypothetical protein
MPPGLWLAQLFPASTKDGKVHGLVRSPPLRMVGTMEVRSME